MTATSLYASSDFSSTVSALIPGLPCPTGSTFPGEVVALEQCICRAGYYGDSNGVECTPCIEGTYRAVTGIGAIAECLACPMGSASLPGSSLCTSCPAGSFADLPGSPTCEACPAFSSGPIGSTSVMQCSCLDGYLGSNGSFLVDCVCSAGYFGVNSSSCTACPPGSSSPIGSNSSTNCLCDDTTGVGNCSSCMVKWYGDTTGAIACTRCPYGTNSTTGSYALDDCTCFTGYTATEDGVVCAECGTGTYKPTTGTGTCTMCPPGTTSVGRRDTLDTCQCLRGYTAVSDGIECTECPEGTYKTEIGATGCVGVCPTGTSSETGSDKLTDCKCNIGYAATEDGTACSPCQPGTYKNSTGMGLCQTCPLNTSSAQASDELTDCRCFAGYTAGSDGIACSPCEIGTYKDVVGTVGCQMCPNGTSSVAGTALVTGCTCLEGYVGSAGAVCTMCPVDTYCVGGVLTNCPLNGHSLTGSFALDDCVCSSGYFR
ncbi:hypothetical protein T484DRAFT_1624263 [Baffinella frigidus]|nr:hypothetical protein T484DRAFT_1624263 [Cryptophyta sp. CCMP2293]